jgi:hypothetical protein
VAILPAMNLIIRRLILALALAASVPAVAQAPPPVPALPDTERRTTYSLSGSTCACAVGFALYGDSTDVGNWISVWINGVQIAQTGNWAISSPTGSLATIPRPITDAILTFTAAQTGTVQIVGARRPRRVSQFAENRGVAARDLNQAVTDIEAQLRELWDRQARTVQAPAGDTLNLLPLLATRANTGACFDSGGNLVSCVTIPSSTFSAGNGISFSGTNPTTVNVNTGPGLTISGGAVQLANAQTGVRQAILSSSVNSVGAPNFASGGAGLNVNLSATATPMTMTFASGFGATFGAVDFVGQLAADATSYWASLPPNQYSFLSVDRNASTGALSASQTLVRPQKGPVFYAPRQALLHFDGSLVDDWGNPWASNGATFTAGCAKFGSLGLRLNGASSYAQTTSILNPGQGAWSVNVWANLDSNVSANIFSVGNSYGMLVATNASGKLILFLSSGGTSWDISPGSSAGATTVTAGSFHHFSLVYNPLSATYVLRLDGVTQLTVSATAIVWPEGVAMAVGAQVGVASTTAGCFDEFEFLPYAKWVADFTPPVAASVVAGDWFDSNAMVMKTATAAGPVWTPVQRLYVAEAITGAGTVTSIYNYSSVSQYRGGAASIDGSGLTRVGNHVTFAAAPQFITNWQTIGSPYTWVIPPAVVPPDATYFYIQVQVGHAALAVTTGTTNQDCTFVSRLPTGIAQNGALAWTAFSNYTGMGTATNTAAFTEGAGAIIQVPIINGIASIETIIGGTTCTQQAANAASIKQAVVTGYDLP